MASKPTSQKKQLQLLIALLVAFAAMSAYSFRGHIDLPTEAKLKRLRAQLADRQFELNKATEDATRYREELAACQQRHALLKYNPNLEREANNKLNRILDDASVTKTKSTVQTLQNRAKSNLQQVNIQLVVQKAVNFQHIARPDLPIAQNAVFQKLHLKIPPFMFTNYYA